MSMLKRVLNSRVVEVLPEPTPFDLAPNLSERLGQRVYIKREDLTPVFSFKLRGAYNRVSNLTDAEMKRGVIAASAGNHAQGVAFASQRLGVACQIVMPQTTPRIKVDAVRRYGADIELIGDSYSDAAERCRQLALDTGRVVIPPYDDLDVIAGQGTIGLEILRQAPRDLSTIYVPVGGGGLISGIAAVIKEVRPQVRIIGVQPDDSNAMQLSLERGERVDLDRVGIFSDGVAVRRVGDQTLKLCLQYVDLIVTVSVDEVCAAIRDAFLDTRTMLEPSGALGIAGLKKRARLGLKDPGSVALIASGANISYSRFGYIVERAEVGENREAILSVEIPERRGAFLEFCGVIGDRAITEFNYRLASRERALIFVGLEVEGTEQTRALCEALRERGFPTSDLSHDDIAKTHVRHMVGGRSAEVQDEVLYSFEFPERPGAFMEFLRLLGHRWNISLFHYRNHGAAFGRVLCGMEVPAPERGDLEQTLAQIGFDYRCVNASPAAAFLLSTDA
ncbi:MAG: L-threonine dehydratase biosynthetic IlvA [Pseudomonadota bacterium]|jgi:threonine dehydratase